MPIDKTTPSLPSWFAGMMGEDDNDGVTPSSTPAASAQHSSFFGLEEDFPSWFVSDEPAATASSSTNQQEVDYHPQSNRRTSWGILPKTNPNTASRRRRPGVPSSVRPPAPPARSVQQRSVKENLDYVSKEEDMFMPRSLRERKAREDRRCSEFETKKLQRSERIQRITNLWADHRLKHSSLDHPKRTSWDRSDNENDNTNDCGTNMFNYLLCCCY